MKLMKKLSLAATMILTITLAACAATGNDTTGPGELANFFPFHPNTLATFTVEGVGEPGLRTIYNTYISGNRVQRMIHATAFAPSLEIIEVSGSQVRLVFGDPFYYNLEDMTDVAQSLDIVLLQTPLQVGTSWNNGDETSTITAIDAQIETPFGAFTAIEVTTISADGSEEKFYYAEGFGLVKSIHPSPIGTFVVSLAELATDRPAEIPLDILFPNIDENVIDVETRILHATTNTDLVPLLTRELSVPPASYALPLLPEGTAINSIEVSRAINVAHVDVSSSLRNWDDLGDGVIGAVFVSLTNTLGLFYEVEYVLWTMDGASFEWGPIVLNDGDAVRIINLEELTGGQN